MNSKQKTNAWALVVLAIMGLTIYGIGHALTVQYQTPLTCCMKEAGTGGGLALNRWIQACGYQTQPLQMPIWQVNQELTSPTGNCVFTAGDASWSPWHGDLTESQWQQFETWIRQGNVLVVMTDKPSTLPKSIAKFFELPTPALKTALNLWEQDAVTAKPELEPFSTAEGDRLVVQANGPRWPPASEKPGDVGEQGEVLRRYPLDKGYIYLLLDNFAWSNAGLDQGDNAAILARIFQRELTSGVVGFDEYRHGHGQVESLMTLAMRLPGVKTFTWMVGLWGLVYLYARNRRFGPPKNYEPTERRTVREHIDSLAYLYERARAAPLAVKLVAARHRSLAAQRSELDPAYEQLLQKAEAYAASSDRPAHAGQACDLVSELVQYRKQLHGS